MRVLIAGGKLQGLEVTYLCKKAGYKTIVLDKNPNAPAFGLADEIVVQDIMKAEKVLPYLEKVDVIFPVIEDEEVLAQLVEYGKLKNIPVLFDLEAYGISSSKKNSNELFEKLKLSMPQNYPGCDFPVIMKPDNKSGSDGVQKAENELELKQYLENHKEETVITQEFMDGPSYSLEVIGDGHQFYFPMITEIVVDNQYDCSRVVAPAILSPMEEQQMLDIGEKLAEALCIKGIFDIEVISSKGVLKILEIDARFPSQTPISVYCASGINMVKLMIETQLLKKKISLPNSPQKYCFYQQIHCEEDRIEMLGEHIMSSCGPVSIYQKAYGADEVITDYKRGQTNWNAIVIITRASYLEAQEAYDSFLRRLHEKIKNDGREIFSKNIRIGDTYDKISV